MRELQSSKAKAHLSRLLDDVERGETILITRHGRRIARLVPEVDRRREDIARAIEEIKASRKLIPDMRLDELLATRHEGHKY